MNRIILIGNGFDLAHNLPTSYKDFINHYWEQWGEWLQGAYLGDKLSDELCSISQKESLYLGSGFSYTTFSIGDEHFSY